MTDYPHHHADHWDKQRRTIKTYTLSKVTDCGDSWEFSTTDSTGFMRSKADIGRDLQPGQVFDLETVNWSTITGLRVSGVWLFRLTSEDLAREARQFHEDLERRHSEELDRNRHEWQRQEDALPAWLKARIERFHTAAGDKFKREGWGYELVICRLADLLDRGMKDDADALAKELGASGNQWDCAQALARFRPQDGDGVAVRFPAGLSPITGSVDYS